MSNLDDQTKSQTYGALMEREFYADEARRLAAELLTLRAERCGLRGRLAAADTCIRQLEIDKTAQAGQIVKLGNQRDAAYQQRDDLRQQRDEANHAWQLCRDDLEKAEGQIAEAQKQIAALQKQIKEMGAAPVSEDLSIRDCAADLVRLYFGRLAPLVEMRKNADFSWHPTQCLGMGAIEIDSDMQVIAMTRALAAMGASNRNRTMLHGMPGWVKAAFEERDRLKEKVKELEAKLPVVGFVPADPEGVVEIDLDKVEAEVSGCDPSHGQAAWTHAPLLISAVRLARARIKELEADRSACNGSCDIALARRQVGPDGVVPSNARECAELWEREAARLCSQVKELEARTVLTEERLSEALDAHGHGSLARKVFAHLCAVTIPEDASRSIVAVDPDLAGHLATLRTRIKELEARPVLTGPLLKVACDAAFGAVTLPAQDQARELIERYVDEIAKESKSNSDPVPDGFSEHTYRRSYAVRCMTRALASLGAAPTAPRTAPSRAATEAAALLRKIVRYHGLAQGGEQSPNAEQCIDAARLLEAQETTPRTVDMLLTAAGVTVEELAKVFDDAAADSRTVSEAADDGIRAVLDRLCRTPERGQ